MVQTYEHMWFKADFTVGLRNKKKYKTFVGINVGD